MKKSFFIAILSVFSICPFAAASKTAAPQKVEIAAALKIYSADGERELAPGEEWFGFNFTDDGAELKKYRTVIEKIEPDSQDRTEIVTVDAENRPEFLIRGLDALKEGPVTSADYSKQHRYDPLLPGQSESFTFDGSPEIQLFVFGATARSPKNNSTWPVMLKQYRIELVAPSGPRQTIFSEKEIYAGNYAPRLIWAGDIDGDGKLDLIIQTLDNGCATYQTLFLSSLAKKGELMRKAVDFEHPCN